MCIMAMLKKNRCGKTSSTGGNLRALVQTGSNQMHVTFVVPGSIPGRSQALMCGDWFGSLQVNQPTFYLISTIYFTLQSYPQESILYPKPPSQLNHIPTNCLTGTDKLVLIDYSTNLIQSLQLHPPSVRLLLELGRVVDWCWKMTIHFNESIYHY